jgi:putative ATPase
VEDLFQRASTRDRRGQPLAERMRPATLAEFVGQEHLLGPGKWLRRAIETKQLASLILWGPPGTGKTTLGRLLAAETGADFVAVSAVMSGVKELREAVAGAAARRDQRGQRTLLFVDEIHRFNKAQQDALLPHVEAGTVVLVGATTENPSFEVIGALLSRAKVLVLKPLGDPELRALVERALADPERGLGREHIDCPPEVRELLAREAAGDARRALATLESAAAIAAPDAGGVKHLDRAVVEEALQRRALLYDKAGDEHYAVVSAFIKSMRGTDPDAAVYWMARMLEAGEDPLFVLRRMVIFAAEDVGNADPRALQVAVAAMEAFRFVGMPEGFLPMTQAAIYLATAPKSNTAMTTYLAAKADVDAHGALPVPLPLRPASTPLNKSLGFGQGYQYPHDFDQSGTLRGSPNPPAMGSGEQSSPAPDAIGHWVDQEYLPEALRGRRYYQPTQSGQERAIAERLAALRKPR